MEYLFIISFLVIFYFIVLQRNIIENVDNTTVSKIFNSNVNVYALYIPKREYYIKNILNKVFMNVIYHKGVDKDKLVTEKLIADNLITKEYASRYFFNTGRVACHLGHINILKEFIKTSKEYSIIFEDDIYIDDNRMNDIKIKLNAIINNIPKDADIVYISYCYEYCNYTKKYNDLFNISHKPLCRHFYLVSKNGATKIINNTLPMYENGDVMYSNLIRNNILKAYNVNNEYLNIIQNREVLGSNLKNGTSIPPTCVTYAKIAHIIRKEGSKLFTVQNLSAFFNRFFSQ